MGNDLSNLKVQESQKKNYEVYKETTHTQQYQTTQRARSINTAQTYNAQSMKKGSAPTYAYAAKQTHK